MSVIAALIRAGVDADLVAEVASEIAAARAEGAASVSVSRTARQERNARYYARKASEKRLSASYSDVSDGSKTASDGQPSPRAQVVNTTSSLRSEGMKALTSFEPKSKPKADRGHRLPEGWEPSETDREYGRKIGRSPRQIADDAEEMRQWAYSAGGSNTIKRNWSIAFQGWMRRNQKQNPRAGPAPAKTGGFAALATQMMRGEDERDHDEIDGFASAPCGSGNLRHDQPLFDRTEGDQFSEVGYPSRASAFG